jgi:threonine dehydrogenase-like Zn-dependent dehydrogenase
MKAAVLHGPRDFSVENVGDPALEPDGAIIRVKACGICGSDLHRYHQGGSPQALRILGHEFSGEVAEVGANVTDIKPGDRVVVGGAGAYAEYVGIPRVMLNRNVFPLPDDMSYEVGATVEPASVGVNAAKRAEPRADDVVVVLGAGMIGQGTWQAFKAMGVSKVIVSEIGKRRLEITRALGADLVINAAEENPVERINEITSGEGADIVAECAGSASALQQASEMVRGGGYWKNIQMMLRDEPRPRDQAPIDILSDGGKIMLVASYEAAVEWQPTIVMAKGVRMIGCIAGRLGESLDLMRAGRINTKPLVTHEFPLDRITEAFETQAKPEEAVKVVIKP